MTNHENTFTDPEKLSNHEQQLHDLFASLKEIAHRHSIALQSDVFSLSDDEQGSLIQTTNRYATYEFGQYPALRDLPVRIMGNGLLYAADLDGYIQGTERIKHGDEVTGIFSGVCMLTVPTIEWLAKSDDGDTLVDDEILAPVAVLKNSTFKADLHHSGEYDTEADLSNFYTYIPLTYYIDVLPAKA